MSAVTALVCLTLVVGTSIGYETGAPTVACSSMTPNHLDIEPEPLSSCPFEVTQSRIVYGNMSETITVTLATLPGSQDSFRGFLIKAFNPLNGRSIGQFTATSDAVQILPQCHGATHTSRVGKKSVTLIWTPTDVEEGDPLVVFRTTFVQSFTHFYVGVDSKIDGESAIQHIANAINGRDSGGSSFDEDE
ncbi:putative defense protein 3 [Galendromus occidentalis]|uniref:Defense protein 3 n=1 Tax=Galendromus occidentalis TaxID=34638 RepID=A0AAJ6QYR3_9ACAR|nr:putative defense protein 3 [Galendromus occidentalis]